MPGCVICGIRWRRKPPVATGDELVGAVSTPVPTGSCPDPQRTESQTNQNPMLDEYEPEMEKFRSTQRAAPIFAHFSRIA